MTATFQTATYTPDHLIASNAYLLVNRNVTIAAGQTLQRGSVLGKASDGKYHLSVATASDGSEVPDVVLTHDADSTGSDVQAIAYSRGDFAEPALILGAGHTPDTVRETLRGKGIVLIPTLEA